MAGFRVTFLVMVTALLASSFVEAIPKEPETKPAIPEPITLDMTNIDILSDFPEIESMGLAKAPFYAQPSTDACNICQFISDRVDFSAVLSPSDVPTTAAEVCDTIERDVTRTQCHGIAKWHAADLLHNHCSTACSGEEEERQRRATCRSHLECSTTQFCSQNQECEACSVCALKGVSFALGGYCPCLGGTIEGSTPVDGQVVTGGTLQPVVFKTENVGPAVNIELYIRGENQEPKKTVQQFVRVPDAGETTFQWPVSRFLDSGFYYLQIQSIANRQIVGLIPSTGYFEVVESRDCYAHEVCPKDRYCDEWQSCYYCDECEYWDDAFDGKCPEKCFRDVAKNAKVTFALPNKDSKIATNSYLPVVWSYNELVLDYIDLYLLPVNSYNALVPLSVRQSVAAGSMAWQVPRSFDEGYFYIVATHTADETFQVIGHTPDSDEEIGDTGFEIFRVGCGDHDDCEDYEYCQTDGSCFPCEQCFQLGDAFDTICPEKCGAGTTLSLGERHPDVDEAKASGPLLEFIVPGCQEHNALQHMAETDHIKFALPTSNGDPTLMSERLRRHLSTLAAAVPGVFGPDAYVKVLLAYVEPPADITQASLHNVGRAAIINVENMFEDFVSDKLGVLSGLAIEAGFDFVEYQSEHFIYVSVIEDGCRQDLDLVFLLDGSGSIDSPVLGGAPGTFSERVLGFVSQVTSFFTIAEDRTRVAVATFATDAVVNIRLNDYFDGDELREAINNIPYPRGQTHTSLGLRAVRLEILQERFGMRPSSKGIPRVLVVLTDGNSQPSYDPATEASFLHDENINVFAIGVGTSISQSQLQDIASDPDHDYIFNLRSFSLIGDIVDAMSATTCEAPAVLTAGDTVTTSVAPCTTLFFRPLCGQITNLNIELASDSGAAIMFVARNNEHPSPFNNDYALTSDSPVKRLAITRASDDTDPIYISVQSNHNLLSTDPATGLLPNVDFKLTIFSDIFPGVETSVVQKLESTPVGSVIFRPPSTTLADPQPVFEYYLVGRQDEQFSVDSTTGEIRLSMPLDREVVSTYNLRLAARATSLSCLTGAIDIRLDVLDVNDNAPVFQQPQYVVVVEEGLARGTAIVRVLATDADSAENSAISYSLASTNTPFSIDGTTGVIVNTEILYNENAEEHKLIVVASDGTYSTTTTVVVTVKSVPCPVGQASATGTLPCKTCASGSYQDGSFPVADQCRECGCGANQYAQGTCTAKRNFDCVSCPAFSSSTAGSSQLSDCTCNDGYFAQAAGGGGFLCLPCTATCAVGYFQSAPCTSQRDAMCSLCRTTCPNGKFLTGTCGGTSDRECQDCTPCQPGSYITSPCQTSGNRQCAACTTYSDCAAGTEYLDGQCATGMETSSPQCRTCVSECKEGFYLDGECGGADGTQFTECKQCTPCVAGQYLISDCTDTENRVCADCVQSCEAGFYVVGECDPASTTAPQCEQCTTADDCAVNEYFDASKPCAGRSSPECKACHPSCASCSGPGSDQCLDCPGNQSLHDGECLDECPRGFYSDSGECVECSANCVTCSGSSDSCTSCDGSSLLVLLDGQCVLNCPSGMFKDYEAGICRICKTCSGQTYKVGGCSGATNTQCEPWREPCLAGVEYESVTPNSVQNRECTACITTCPSGEELVGECISEPRTCTGCSPGFFKESDGDYPCLPCRSSCGPSEFLTGDCTQTTSPVCEKCQTECDNGFYLSGVCDGSRSVPECKQCAVCEDGEYTLRSCSDENGGSDTQCRTCTQECPENHFMSSLCSADSDAVCTPCTQASSCLSTEVLVGTCGGTSNTECVPCHPECLTCFGPGSSQCETCHRGVFLNGTECHSECPVGRYESIATQQCEKCHSSCRDCVGPSSTACTSCDAPLFLLGTECLSGCPTGYFADTESRTCRECRTCPSGSFKTGGCSGTSDTTCQLWDTCDLDEYQTVEPSAFRNRECAECRQSCPAGSELTGPCGGESGTNNPTCEPCDAGFFKDDSGAGSCQACRTSCPTGSFLVGQCSSTMEPSCQTCRASCTGDRFLSGTCAGSVDFDCTACDTCGDGEYEVMPCLGQGQNRVCAACRTECPAGQHLTGVCQGTEQPLCADCLQQEDCGENEFVSGVCGGDDGRSATTCELCHDSCARCSGPLPTQCTGCYNGTHLDLESGRCLSECPTGFFENNGVCSACHDSCGDCERSGSQHCTECDEGLYLLFGECLEECSPGFYANSTTGRCHACSACASGTFASSECTSLQDTQCQAWSVCAEGTFETTAPSSVNDRQCSDCRTECPPGQELSVPCTATRNAQCTPCSSTTFKPVTGPELCDACTSECAGGFFLTGTCTATTSPVCSPCTTTCAAGFFLEGECAGRNSPSCVACDTCDAGTYETRACTVGGNRQCSPCTAEGDCSAGEYLEGACTPTSSPQCKPCTTPSQCAPNEFLQGTCAADEPNPTCQTCTVCAGDEYETAPCTATSDRTCAPCTSSCPNGQFLTGACPGSLADDFPRTVVLDGVTYAALSGAFPTDASISCQADAVIPPGWSLVTDLDVAREVIGAHAWGATCMVVDAHNAFATTSHSTLAPGEVCQCDSVQGCMTRSDVTGAVSVTACPRGILIQWQSPECEACTASCPAGHFLFGECAGRSNPVCRPCTVCEDGSFETVPCTHLDVGTQDRVCEPCTTIEDCAEGEYLSGECTATSSPVCKPCTDSCQDGYYLSGTCGGTSNPVCEECSSCVEGESFETAECTETSDTQCQDCTKASDCGLDQFLGIACTLDSDAVCQRCTRAVDCDEGFFLSGVCTQTQDATCEQCHATCLDCQAAGALGCSRCPPGSVLSRNGFSSLGQCINDCPPGSAEAQDANECQDCHDSCEECAMPGDENACTKCSGSSFLTANGKCAAFCPAGTYGNATLNECMACTRCDTTSTYESSPCQHASDRVCSALTTCPPGTRVLAQPTATSNRQCADCAEGTFQAFANQQQCSAWRQCGADQYQTRAPTATSNRECGDITDCVAGSEFQTAAPTDTTNRECAPITPCLSNQFISEPATPTSDQTCTNLTVCDATQFESVPPTDESDRECEAITQCKMNEFQSIPPTRFSNAKCDPIRVCNEFEFETKAPTPTSNRECDQLTVCDLTSQFVSVPSTNTSDRKCQDLRVCFDHEFETQAPTEFSNRICQSCRQCHGTEFQVSDCTSAENRVCQTLTQCNTEFQFESLAPTLTSDRECSNCTTCGSGSYTVTPCGHSADTVCDGCLVCPDNHFETTPCTVDDNRSCQECALCEDDQFISSPCSQAQNTVCTNCRVCAEDEFLAEECGESSNTVCLPITNCTSSQFEVSPPTTTSNRKCESLRLCREDVEYESRAPTATSNRECAAITECDFSTHFESQAPTRNSNRVCSPLSVCDPELQFESEAKTETSDRKCTDLSVCAPGQQESVAPTPFSDRQCAVCAAGTTDHNNRGDDACVPCPAGHYTAAGSTGACSLHVCPAGTADTDSRPSTPCVPCGNGSDTYQPSAGQTACLAAQTCPAGEEEAAAPTPVSNRQCVACQLGATFKDIPGQDQECAAVRTCAAGEEETSAPTRSSNRVCTPCADGFVKEQAGQTSVCVEASVCQAGFQQVSAATATQDTQCEACPADTFKTTAGPAACVPHSACAAVGVQFQTRAPSATNDRECADVTVCEDNEWQEVAPTTTSNRVCKPCRSCAADGLTEETACTETSNTVCENCNECAAGDYIAAPCTGSEQTQCSECSVCDLNSEYQERACLADANTVCMPLTVCGNDTFESVAPSQDSDRECEDLTVCGQNQWECVAPTFNTNRQCCNLDVCDAGQEESKAPTATSNRECRQCPAGTTDDDLRGDTECVTCPAGTFVPEGSVGDCSAFRCRPGTVDHDSNPATACQPCVAGDSFAGELGMTVCANVTQCPAGERELIEPTARDDRVCESCPTGTFKASVGQSDCIAASSCDSNAEYVSVAHTATSNTICAVVTTCSPTQYQTAAPTAFSDRRCRNLTVCDSNQFQDKAPTAVSDRSCKDIREPCPVDQYESAAPTATTDRQCADFTSCGPEQFIKVAPTPFSDRVCEDWTVCTEDQYQTQAPTLNADRKCANLTVCSASQFEAVEPTAFSNRVCEDCTVCPGGTHFEVSACTATSNAVCDECSTCPEEKFASAACTEDDDTQCSNCRKCILGVSFEVMPCLENQNRVCDFCTACNSTQYVEATCTLTSDTVCPPYTVCGPDEWESTAATDFSDRQCTKHTICNPNTEFENEAPTAFSDRDCDSLTVCSNSQYISTTHTATSDRICTALRQCTSSEYETKAPTSTTNRECARLTICDSATQYETVPPGPARDRSCASLTVCSPLEYESVAPTPTSNRECEDQVLPELAPLAHFSASGGLALSDAAAYTASEAAQAVLLMQGTANAEEGTGPTLHASVGTVSTTASIDVEHPAPSAVRFELANDGAVYQDDAWVRGVFQVTSERDVIPRSTVISMTVTADESNAVSASCTTNSHGLCSVAAAIPSSWFVSFHGRVAGVTVQFAEPALQLPNGPVSVVGAAEHNVTITALSVFAPTNDVYVRLPSRDVLAGETLDLTVYSRTTFAVGSFAAEVRSLDSSRLAVSALGLDFGVWQGSTKVRTSSHAAVLGFVANSRSQPVYSDNGDQELFTITATVPSDAQAGEVELDITLHSLENRKGAQVRPGSRSLPTRVVFVDRDGADSSDRGVIAVSGAAPSNIFAAPATTLIADTASLSGQTISFPVNAFAMGPSGGLSALDSSRFVCTSSNPDVVAIGDSCALSLADGGDLASSTAVVTVTLIADSSISASFTVHVMRPALPLVLEADDTELNAVTGWLDETNNCNQIFQATRVRAFTTFSDGSGAQLEHVDVTRFVALEVSNDGVATLSIAENGAHNFGGAIVQGFQPGSVSVTATVRGQQSSLDITVSSTPVVATRLDARPVVGVSFTAGSAPAALPFAAGASPALVVDSTMTQTGQVAFVAASVVLSDATRLELGSDTGLRLVSDDAEVVEVQGQGVVARSRVQPAASSAQVEAIWSSGVCSVSPIATASVNVPMNLPVVDSLAASADRTVLAAPGTIAASAPFSHATSSAVLLVATLSTGARLSLTDADSLDVAAPPQLAVSETSSGIVVSVVDSAPVGTYDVMVTYETASVNVTFTVADVADLQVDCRLHANGHTSATANAAITVLAPYADATDANTFQACALSVRGVLQSSSGQALAETLTQEVTASASVTADAALSVGVSGGESAVVSVASPSNPALGDATVSVSAGGVTKDVVLTIGNAAVSLTSGTMSFVSTLRGFAGEEMATPDAELTFSDGSSFDSPASLPAGIVSFVLDEPSPAGADGAAASLDDASSGLVVLQANSVQHLSLSMVAHRSDANTPDEVLAESTFACNLAPRVGSIDFGFVAGLPLPSASAGSLLSFEIRGNGGTDGDIDTLQFDVLFNSAHASFLTASAGSDFVGSVNAFTFDSPTALSAGVGDATHFVRITVRPNAGVAGVVHLASITFTLDAGVADQQLFFSGRVTQFTTRGGAVDITGGASVSSPMAAPAASVSAVASEQAAANRRRRRDVATSPCLSPPCSVCDGGADRQTGDVDGNCVFTLDDVTYFADAFLEDILVPGFIDSLLPTQAEQLDADGDGDVSVLDMSLLSSVLAKDIRFVRDASVQPVSTANGCRLEIAARVFGAGDLPAQPNNTHVYFDIESGTAGFDTLFANSVLEVGEVVPVDKGTPSLQGGLWKAAHLGGDLFGVVVRTPLQTEDMHGLTIFQATTLAAEAPANINVDGLSFIWSGSRSPAFEFDGFDFELVLGDMPAFRFVRSDGYNPLLHFSNEQATADCHASTACGDGEYEITAATPTSSAVCGDVQECDSEEYETQAPTDTSNRVCAPRTQCNFPVQYETSAGTATTDRACAAVTTCGANETVLIEATPFSDRLCRTDIPCKENEYELVPLTVSTNRVCRNLTVCDPGFEEAVPPTATSDRECSAVDFCASSPCVNGVCQNDPAAQTFQCVCDENYIGDRCQHLDACAVLPNPCANGGKCISDEGGIRCKCRKNRGFACACCDGFTSVSCASLNLDDTGDFCLDPDLAEIEFSARTDNSRATSDESLAYILGGALGGLALIALLSMAIMAVRRRRDEGIVAYQKDPFGTITSLNNPLFSPTSQYLAAFKRVVCFAYLRYDRALSIKGPAEEYGPIYDILMVPRPPKRVLPALKEDMNALVSTEAGKEKERSCDQVADLLALAMADLLVEEAIDASAAAAATLDGGRPYRPSVPSDASGLLPKRWAAYLDPVTGQVEEPVYEALGDVTDPDFEDTYAVDGSVSPLTYMQAERFLARRVSSRKATLRVGKDPVSMYDRGDGGVSDLYSKVAKPEPTYDVGGALGENDGPTYDNGGGVDDGEPTYDQGNNVQEDYSLNPLGDMEDYDDEEATYDMANADPSSQKRKGKGTLRRSTDATYSRATDFGEGADYDNAARIADVETDDEGDDDAYDRADLLDDVLNQPENTGDGGEEEGDYDVRTIQRGDTVRRASIDASEPVYVLGDGEGNPERQLSAASVTDFDEPAYDFGAGDENNNDATGDTVLGVDVPYDFGAEDDAWTGEKNPGDVEPSYDMATTEGDTTGNHAADSDLLNELQDEPDYDFARPKNTSVRPRQMRSMRVRSRTDSVNNTDI